MSEEKKERLTRSFLGMLAVCLLWIILDICDTMFWKLGFNKSSKGLLFLIFVYATFLGSIILLFANNAWLRTVKPAMFCLIGYLILAFSIVDIITLLAHLQISIVK